MAYARQISTRQAARPPRRLRRIARAFGDFDPITGDDVDPVTGASYHVLAYRGGAVASRDGWVADATARGGVITQVPGGFFQGVECARFGSAASYTYELPPVWLLVWDGVDVAADEFMQLINYQGIAESDFNQVQAVSNAVSPVSNGLGNALANLPTIVKWVAIAGVALVAIELLSFVPKAR